LVVLLDDLENLSAVQDVLKTLKATLSIPSMRDARILFGLATTPSGWNEFANRQKHEPLSRFFRRIPLDNLTEEELSETVLQSVLGAGVSIDNEIVKRIFEYTQGHPYEMQVLGYHLFNNQISRRIELDVWEKGLQAAIGDLGFAVFDNWYAQASVQEAQVLRIVAEMGGKASRKEIDGLAREKRIRLSSGNIPKYLQRLVDKHLVEKKERGVYRIPDKLFCFYLNRIGD
jgi:hypothetical protein